MKNKLLNNAAYDLKFLLNRGYRKKGALNFVSNKYLLNKDERNYLFRRTFSDSKSISRKGKIISLDEIVGRNIFVDGYNVLITSEIIINQEYDSLVMCDDGVLRDLKAVFGKYNMDINTEKVMLAVTNLMNQHHPLFINFLFDSPVSKSGELAKLTNSILEDHRVNGTAETVRNVDYELVKRSNASCGVVATSDGVIMDRVENILDIPYWFCMENNCSKNLE
ncbi:protein of unknown function DUF434 [Methanobacterium lacus]|uniref:DUF434 domain-containing protein n=1 Tax=Methanobacterium lacus (strain AL-21) TaxID=877455 RepID=F0TA11_METLA|nr:DUF434 domain-containing protein [Methanobacterium lacus]ADZ08834.1 protein of unknown function DUF434 [Methanobacterium lacus]